MSARAYYRHLAWLPGLAAVLLADPLSVRPAAAQLGGALSSKTEPVQRDQPVYYQADRAEYDRDTGIVTMSGHVEIWQNDRILRADKVTYDRNTGVAAATGNVVLVDPGGQVVFSDYAELSQGMKDGVLRSMRAILAENGKLAANGARRIDAKINELSRAIYSTCDLCKDHPDRAPLWDIRARSAIQDLENKKIEYKDAVVDIYGIPVAYMPYLTQPDPSQKRASGFLIPSFGSTSHLGPYLRVPYFWAIDQSQDATIAPMITGDTGPAMELQYRRRFNDGTLIVNSSIATDDSNVQGHIFSKGQFALNDIWRWGFDLNRASSADYLRDFKITDRSDVLTSDVYLEGFGQGAWSRLETRSYQSLNQSISSNRLPLVLPRYQYSFFGEPDSLGGRLSVDAGAFNLIRDVGTNTRRANLDADWQRPFTGQLGDLHQLVLHVDSAAYSANRLFDSPNYADRDTGTAQQAMPTVGLLSRWPFARTTSTGGSELIEPIIQVLAAPRGSSYSNTAIPNEDSLDPEFTDATLFAINRYPGIDRLEGGDRANAALHGAWYMAGSGKWDALIGQGYRTTTDPIFPHGSGLEGTVTDVVSHLEYSPNSWLDFTSRQRFDHRNFDVRFFDGVASAGPDVFKVNAGYLFTATDPYSYYDTPPSGTLPGPPRNEVTVGANTHYGHWRFGASQRQDLEIGKPVSASVNGAYEDECFIFSGNFYRRYTELNGDHGATTFLFQITLKTVGEFGFNPL